MAKASQSKADRAASERPGSGSGSGRTTSRRTKLPEFDPSELEDLIFTPAVGSGVGSHLLRRVAEPEVPGESPDAGRENRPPIDMPTVVLDEPTPVGHIQSTTVDMMDVTTVAMPSADTPTALILNDGHDSTTVDMSVMTPVVVNELPTVAGPSPVVEAAAVVTRDSATVDMSTVAFHAAAPPSLWLSESGEIVPASRVKRIRLAQDVLSPAEESVYDTLWGVKSAAAFKQEGESYRIVQAGYDFLMKRTRLSKKTIQRIVDRLIDKGFIAIEKPADIYLRSSTVYRVFAYRAVLDRQAQKGRFHVAKIGPGFVYVREVGDPRHIAPPNLSTVGNSVQPTVAGMDPSTAPGCAPPTGAVEDPTTVVSAAINNKEQQSQDSASSSAASPSTPVGPVQGREAEVRELRSLLERYLGFIDDAAARQLLRQCRLRAADCTLEEIAYFVSHKLRSVNGIHNPVGFILTAVPRHFENHGHAAVRAFLREEEERRRRIWQEEYRYWQSVAEDHAASPEERAQAAEVIASLDKSLDGAGKRS